MTILLGAIEAVDYGIAGVLLTAIVAGGRVAFKRLFDDKAGLLTLVARRHIRFVDAVERQLDEVARKQDETNRLLRSVAGKPE